MVTCEPEWEPALARMSMTGTDDDGGGGAGVTAVGEMQPMLTVQPNLYFGVSTLAHGNVVVCILAFGQILGINFK